MQVTVFGASGKVGQQVVECLFAAGHNVVAFVHSSAPFAETKKLTIAKGDVHDARAVEQAINGSQAVISTLGSWHTPSKDILSAAMRFAIPAMQQQGIRRVITLTGSAAMAPGDVPTVGSKITSKLFGIVGKDILRDGEEHLRLLAASDLDWTTLRASIIKQGAPTQYRLNSNLPKAWETISRQTVAQALVDQLTSAEHLQQAPHIHG